MNIINRLFNKIRPRKECPRCLGKGNVDWDDIKRLNKELKWTPGTCAYCNGIGKIDSRIEKNVPVDATYLTNTLSHEERSKIINADANALERAKAYEVEFEGVIKQICYLHFGCNLTSLQIAEFFLITKSDSVSYNEEKEILIEYINRVIQIRKP